MKGLKKLLIIVFSICLSVVLTQCVHEPLDPEPAPGEEVPDPDETPGDDEECDPDVVYFENEVLPILLSNCAKSGCHDASTAEDGIILDSYAHVMNSDVVDAGDASDSELFEKITEDDLDDRMPPPPAAPLTESQINIIRVWIEQGTQDNECASPSCDTTNVTYETSIRPIIQNKCLGCHSGSAASGGLNFSSHTVLQNVALDGRLVGAITHAAGFVPMPQGGKLPECDIEKIVMWVEDGAPNN
jgi:hypothetical protein